MDLKRRIWSAAPVLIVGLAAIALRLYAIDRLPPGLFGDEAVEGLDALDVLAGNGAIWFHAHQGREPIYVYLVALSYWAFGVTPLATRLPALIAGLLTIPATWWMVREWAAGRPAQAAVRLAGLTTALLAISFWHIQMTRDAHRDTLVPLVEAVGYAFLWRGLRTHSWKAYAAAGLVLGLAIYTYSPGRFVGVFVALYIGLEFLISRFGRRATALVLHWLALIGAGGLALLVMMPLGVYFAQNPDQFFRRFDSVSVLDAESPVAALAASVAGNLLQYVVPGAGYQSTHYNLPGKPIFDLLIAPWLLVGVAIALGRWRRPEYRFLLLWFGVMMMPAFLTTDMTPKAVRCLGVVPGVFVFPALAIEWLLDRVGARTAIRETGHGADRVRQGSAVALVALSIGGSAIWTTYDYFVGWANLPGLPLAFDADMTEASAFIRRQPASRSIYLSSDVYRPPTQMLLGRLVPTTRYIDRATRIREFDARTALVAGPGDTQAAYVWIGDCRPPEGWLERLAPHARQLEIGTYISVVELGVMARPQRQVAAQFSPLMILQGYSVYQDEPSGIALNWQLAQLPDDRQDVKATVFVAGKDGVALDQQTHRFGVPALEWAIGDSVVEWYPMPVPDGDWQLKIQLVRGSSRWLSPVIAVP